MTRPERPSDSLRRAARVLEEPKVRAYLEVSEGLRQRAQLHAKQRGMTFREWQISLWEADGVEVGEEDKR
jgi:hypothetical protein